ncbi:hypothetical protein [Streptomyces sp. NBC_00470]|uniref:hypothetical protein n=1 Tax=Streptomyces sp. NBC_00470 TaxID=2975753 RepID=UPI0030DF2D95
MACRADWKKWGRFNIQAESDYMDEAMRRWQSMRGDTVAWFHLLKSESEYNPIYDESAGAGKEYNGPIYVPVLGAYRDQASADRTDIGLNQVGRLRLTMSYRQISRVGLTWTDLKNEKYLSDRIAYDGSIFRVDMMLVLGQIHRRDFIVAFEGTELKDEDIADDDAFKPWYDWDKDNEEGDLPPEPMPPDEDGDGIPDEGLEERYPELFGGPTCPPDQLRTEKWPDFPDQTST